MKATILVLWLSFLNNQHANNEGSLQIVEFNNVAACEIALNKIKESAKYIHGVCVFK